PFLLSPHTSSYLTGGDFARESLARTILDKTPIFTTNLSYEEWIKEVLTKIRMEWPTETKIAIVKAKLDIPYQARLTWELSTRGPVSWQNQIRDLTSWVSTVST